MIRLREEDRDLPERLEMVNAARILRHERKLVAGKIAADALRRQIEEDEKRLGIEQPKEGEEGK